MSQQVKDHKTGALIALLEQKASFKPEDILVVGCGSGLEAGMLARAFAANTVGIDLGSEFSFDHAGAAPAKLMVMDARKLSWPDATFDVIYCFHALEHIPTPDVALREMARVLKPGGSFMLGTPNKSRLIGYIGAAHPFTTKVRWNLKDLKLRLVGRWRNEDGAHAGFTGDELTRMCHEAFGQAELVSGRYYERLYRSKQALIRTLETSGAARLVFPCVYVMGTKTLIPLS